MASCHGSDAKGNGQFPRLAGQLYAYLMFQLTNWSKQRGESTSEIMTPIARGMTDQQITAGGLSELSGVSPWTSWTGPVGDESPYAIGNVGPPWAWFTPLFSWVRAQDELAASTGNVQAKLGYCKDCHGASAQDYFGYFPIPRLAGQQPEYLENQLQAFIEHRQMNNVMVNVARSLSPSITAALPANFRDLNPAPPGGAPRRFVAEGRRIFEDGVPEDNVATCAARHPNATGVGEIPRLACQLYPCLIKELTNWGKERGQNPAKPDIMRPIAHSLTKRQIAAVSAYLSYLK